MSDAPAQTPAQLGLRMPAEWERHEATWIAWPHNRMDWPGKFAGISWVYADIVRHLSQVERVCILVNGETAEKNAHRALSRSGANMDNVRFYPWPTNRVWTRDYGPIFVTGRGQLGVTNWRFNAWAKYPDWQLDDQIPAQVADALSLHAWEPQMAGQRVVLEGGSIDVNGRGTLLTTEECLLSDIQQRNPGLSREQIEQAMHDYLGITRVIWLGCGIAGDDTHGHVDDITRFVSEDTVVTVVEPNEQDYNHHPLEENLRRLRSATTQDGKPLNIAELPLPSPVVFHGQRLPASYANFYIANGLVLVPTFNDKNDRRALSILHELFPKHDVVGIHCGDFIWGLGALHCMTQQQPAVQ